jgi:hypothetical protein
MSADRRTYSRYQILCADREAWLDGETAHSDSFYYDGISFWRRDLKGKQRLIPSWRTPGHGWRHADDCTCELCGQRKPAVLRPRSVA